MRAIARTWAAGLGLSIALALSGCGGDDVPSTAEASPSPGPTRSDVTDPESPTSPSPGQVGSDDCALTQRDVDLVVRDWTRVQGTVGRGDHGRFTSALVRRLDRLADRAPECDGTDEFEAFSAKVAELDRRAGSDPDYPAYSQAEQAGNAWLRAAGLGDNALLRG